MEIPGLGVFRGAGPNLDQQVLDLFQQMDEQTPYECVHRIAFIQLTDLCRSRREEFDMYS